jgi:hypothetical protein
MFDQNYHLNKLKLAEMLADAEKERLVKLARAANQPAPRLAAPPKADNEPAPVPSPTDSAALSRKVREELVRNAQAAFAEVMAELNASQTNTAPYKTKAPATKVSEETDFQTEET